MDFINLKDFKIRQSDEVQYDVVKRNKDQASSSSISLSQKVFNLNDFNEFELIINIFFL